jgi:predicted nuclease with RNAse H fold
LYAIGIDLAARPTKCSGFAVIEMGPQDILKRAVCLRSDESILRAVRQYKRAIVAIDAPIMREPRMRGVDRELIKMGSRVFPPNFSWMKVLSVRAWRIAGILMKSGYEVVETHPRSALLSSGVPDARRLLEVVGVRVDVKDLKKKDLLDAAVASVVAYCVIKGCATSVDDGEYRIYLLKKLS